MLFSKRPNNQKNQNNNGTNKTHTQELKQQTANSKQIHDSKQKHSNKHTDDECYDFFFQNQNNLFSVKVCTHSTTTPTNFVLPPFLFTV